MAAAASMGHAGEVAFRMISILITVAIMGILAVVVLDAMGGGCPEPAAGGTTTTRTGITLPPHLQRELDRTRGPVDCD